MEYFLLQNFYDKVSEHFESGKITRKIYFEICLQIENQRQLFTITLN